ncbi:MAG: hypothetical protein ACFFDT_22535, partial [Candidatus Hodarchaeota archaeon]
MDTQYNVDLEIIRGNSTAQDVEITVCDSHGKLIPALFRVLKNSERYINYSLPLGIYIFSIN